MREIAYRRRYPSPPKLARLHSITPLASVMPKDRSSRHAK
jgi:hypothetical protein